ncbi:MFS transporter [Paractinoplanes rhizophilus]|uniref:MFS transporter n=1 Tax=Paractinoplanes rhizophilus TaxID=1416877 RepID=A0ABW2HLH7_9ACTN|nr:MFS transporter [Actinoplanes sp.]
MTLERALLWGTTTSSLAKGLLFGISALFFTRVIGLSAATVGLGLTIAGGVGLAASFAAGHLSDRLGAGRVLVAMTLCQGAALGAYCLARTAVAFVLTACVAVGAEAAQRTARTTLLAREFTGADRVSVRARLRVATNVFIGVGSVAAAGALTLDSSSGYAATMVAAALLVLSSAIPLRHLPPASAPPVASPGDRVSPLRDRRYVAIAGLNGLLTIQFGVLTVGMPLWVTGHTRAPAATVALILVINTAFVALFQIRAARLARDIRTAGRVVLAAAAFLAVACGLYAGAAHGPALAAAVLLVLGVLAHSAGEVLAESGGWELAFELADPRFAGAYQGISQTGPAIGAMLAPAAVTTTAIDHGGPGWLALGALFLAAGAGTCAIAARAGIRVPAEMARSGT